MMFKKNLLLIVFSISFLFSEYTLAQQATLFGTVKSKQEIAIDGLSVEYKKIGTISDSDGQYLIKLPANIELSIVFSHFEISMHHQPNPPQKFVLHLHQTKGLNFLLHLHFRIRFIR